jgi:adenylate cyclase, class 2
MEEEIKLRVAGHERVRERLSALGATLTCAQTFEQNWVLDDDDGTLSAAGCLLRVRRWGELASVTFKGPAAFAGGVKQREEIETSVGDAAALLALLARVGFVTRRGYEKRRETWRLDGALVALDVTPMGDFVEIEGPGVALPDLARRLGLDPAEALTGSYVALWEEYRRSHPNAGRDMVFR